MAWTTPTPGEARAPLTRCVILTGAPGRRPDRLVEGLERRRLRVLLVEDAPQVMVALAEAGNQALIVNEPDRHHRLAELLGAVQQYYPQTLCWQYEADGQGLVPLEKTAGDVADPAPASAGQVGAGLTRRRPSLLRADLPLALSTHAPTAELTQEELEMLLGPDSDSDAPEESGWDQEHR